MFILHFLLLPALCEGSSNNSLTISAFILSNNNCSFSTAASTLSFGDLNPAAPNDVTATATIDFTCRGKDKDVAYIIKSNDGLYGSRLRHTTLDAYLPYTLSLSPTSGTTKKNTTLTLTITGDILGTDFINAFGGSYSDTVVLTVEP
jgi:spore coat protein U-like protein